MGPDPGTIRAPSFTSFPNTPRSYLASAQSVAMPVTPFPSTSTLPPSAKRDVVEDMFPKMEANRIHSQAGPGLPSTGGLSPSVSPAAKNAISRPLQPPRTRSFVEPLQQDGQQAHYPQSPMRTRRLVSDPLYREQAQREQPLSSTRQPSAMVSQPGIAPQLQGKKKTTDALLPGTILYGGRYRVNELQDCQEWAPGVFEALWLGQDAQRPGSYVMIREVVVPEISSRAVQSRLRAAAVALVNAGRHPLVQTPLDAFTDRDRAFFVFEPVAGESLLARMHRTGRALPEADVIECCLQMTEVLELLSQQMPPLAHGLIRPEHIIVNASGSQYTLINFSVLLAGGASQFLASGEHAARSLYTAPEVARGIADVRSDLYSLLATAYHLVTGSPPAEQAGNIPRAQRLNLTVSSQFEAILAKGLHPLASHRYQRPAELFQDLLVLRSMGSHLAPMDRRRDGYAVRPVGAEQPVQMDSVAQALPILLTPTAVEEDHPQILPRPEELPPLADSNDMRNALLWLGFLVVCVVIIVIVSGYAF